MEGTRLCRRRLLAHVDEPFDFGVPRFQAQARGHGEREQGRRPAEVVPRAPGRQTTERHAEEAGEQHAVGEEGQEQDMGAEPADAGQFEEENEETDEETVETSARSSGRCLRRRWGRGMSLLPSPLGGEKAQE